jgi:hypothetical protein
MARLEQMLNFICPKSLILYAEKRTDGVTTRSL